jgi:hypothetical protein
MSAAPGSDEIFWQRAVRRLSRRIHLAWWLEHWLSLLVPGCLLASVIILSLRFWRNLPLLPALIGLSSALLLSALAAFFLARRRREPLAATRARLEDALSLHSRLSAAAAGIGPWPPRRPDLPLPLSFLPGRPLAMAAFGAALLAAALLIPVSRRPPDAPRLIEPPSALQDVRTWIDEAKKNHAVSQDSTEQVEEKLAELLQRPAQNWYEHSTLEAADHLRDLTASDLQQLSQNLAQAERSASALAASAAGAGLPQAARDALQQQLQSASQAMQNGAMQPGGDLMDALQNLDTSQLSSLSPEQLKKLANQLAQNQQALQQALKNSPSLDLSNLPEGRLGEGEGQNESPGQGAPKRGPGSAPVTLASQDTQLGSTKIESLQNPLDLSRLATGDALSVTNGAAKIDPKDFQGPQQGGATASPGDGGAAVWQNTLIPAERETLKRFFK